MMISGHGSLLEEGTIRFDEGVAEKTFVLSNRPPPPHTHPMSSFFLFSSCKKKRDAPSVGGFFSFFLIPHTEKCRYNIIFKEHSRDYNTCLWIFIGLELNEFGEKRKNYSNSQYILYTFYRNIHWIFQFINKKKILNDFIETNIF